MKDELLDDAVKIGKYLRNFQTINGIIDPLDRHLLPFTYTTAFYALLSAHLYAELSDRAWRSSCEKALRSELNIIEKELITKEFPRFFHWEFKNYSLINIYEVTRGWLRKDLRERLKIAILQWRNADIDSTNWRAMRAYSYYKRFKFFGRKSDLIRSIVELKMVLNSQTKEGLFPDTRNSFSFQYHAYILAVLLQFYKELRAESIRECLLRGVNFVSNFVDPIGDFNYYGRGQEQIKGYCSLIFSLIGASTITSDSIHMQMAEKIYLYLKKFQGDSVFPLCLNNSGNNLGWYYYNHLGDYLSFLGVYFILSYLNYPTRTIAGRKTRISNRSNNETIFYPRLGFLIVKRGECFIVISAGGESTAQIGGISHIYPKFLPCIGGPYDTSDGRDYCMNYMGPVYNGNSILNKTGQIGYHNNLAKLKFNLKDLVIEYIYILERGIRVKLRLTPKREIHLTPLHLCAFQRPTVDIPMRKLRRVPTPDGYATFYEAEPVTISTQKVIDVDLIGEVRNISTSEESGIKIYKPQKPSIAKYLFFSIINFLLHKIF